MFAGNSIRPSKTAALVCGIVAAAAAYLTAEQAPTFTSRTDVVTVYATVRDRNGEFVAGLGKDDFAVFDNGQRQDVATFSSEIQPVLAALVLDRSESMTPLQGRVAAAASVFVHHLLPNDRASLATLTRDCLPLTGDQNTLLSALSALQAWRGPIDQGSPIWGAFDRAISFLRGERGIRAVVTVTDGDGTQVLSEAGASRALGGCQFKSARQAADPRTIIKTAQREDIIAYALALEGSPYERGLKDLSETSGGKFVLWMPRDNLDALLADIADDLHHRYLLGFSPKTFDHQVHRLEVRVTRRDVTVRARQNYVADGPARPYTLNLNSSTSPSFTTYSRPSIR